MEKTEKLKALQAFAKINGLSTEEIAEWINQELSLAQASELLPTMLNLVYRYENELKILNGFDADLKNYLWGIELKSGALVALKEGVWQNVSTDCASVQAFAAQMTVQGKPCRLPGLQQIEQGRGKLEEYEFDRTVSLLQKQGVDADIYEGNLWCVDENTDGNSVSKPRLTFLYDLPNLWYCEGFDYKRIAVAY